MTDKVVSLFSGQEINPGQPDPLLVQMLEDALASARRGEIMAFALVAIAPNGALGDRVVFPQGRELELIGGMEVACLRIKHMKLMLGAPQ